MESELVVELTIVGSTGVGVDEGTVVAARGDIVAQLCSSVRSQLQLGPDIHVTQWDQDFGEAILPNSIDELIRNPTVTLVRAGVGQWPVPVVTEEGIPPTPIPDGAKPHITTPAAQPVDVFQDVRSVTDSEVVSLAAGISLPGLHNGTSTLYAGWIGLYGHGASVRRFGRVISVGNSWKRLWFELEEGGTLSFFSGPCVDEAADTKYSLISLAKTKGDDCFGMVLNESCEVTELTGSSARQAGIPIGAKVTAMNSTQIHTNSLFHAACDAADDGEQVHFMLEIPQVLRPPDPLAPERKLQKGSIQLSEVLAVYEINDTVVVSPRPRLVHAAQAAPVTMMRCVISGGGSACLCSCGSFDRQPSQVCWR
jgi:hypothetical protein